MSELKGVSVEKPRTAFLHYSAAPVVGGVEAVMQAHARTFLEAGYSAAMIAGLGEAAALPPGTEFHHVPLMDTRHPAIARVTRELDQGRKPPEFDDLAQRLVETLGPLLHPYDALIVHNIFGKHFNLPLTAALASLVEARALPHCIAWGHDFSWTSSNSRSKVYPAYPWDLLRTRLASVTYVAVSEQRRGELTGLFDCPPEQIQVVYNGVQADSLLGLSPQGKALADRLDLLASDLTLIMPVRVTRAKNIELAMQVAARLKSQGISPKLVITGPPDPHDEGDISYFHSLQALRKELGVWDEVGFVYELGPDPERGYTIEAQVVGELYRLADVMFMPSHREGFGMPVLEAGLAGLPVLASSRVPAAIEVAGGDAMQFDADTPPDQIAGQILDWMASSPTYRLRRRVRQGLTWEAIFRRDIIPLLNEGETD